MIVTVTANPSLDRAVSLAAPLEVGEVQSALGVREDAGGKGVNVSRVVAAAGTATLAVLPLADQDPYAAALAQTGIPVRAVPVHGHARANLTLADPRGTTTKINLPGAVLDSEDADALIDTIVAATAGADWLVLAGSLPPGAGDDFYVRAILAVRAAHGDATPRIALDTSGAALAAAVAGARPDLIKPNEHELAELTGAAADTRDIDGIIALAQDLVGPRVGAALVTLGAAGALLVTEDGVWVGTAPRITAVSTVGAGDSSLAGYLLADVAGAEPAERLRTGMRYGAAAASLPGTQPPTPADLVTAEIPVQRIIR
ncbi:1-phosphofructokinase [Microbacterium sp. SORGH_AS428]|uniref:1-phosphofructokinase family hexose kinase n=1 Tax=Microbacterium sp. SORGH_AS_0428 TaxID=3041788 RepID=UPI002855523C|nr:1-phosphofructokinase [Microbacterium sp. SORGH_AS_0428]MDR6198163.1 1-phosphofructokinase [Microbacterium sp. SORGH_AS_0428]